MVTLLTFDVEEFDAPLDFGRALDEETQLRIGGEGWRRVLELLDELGLPATLFVTASVARSHPDLLVRSARSHEIASHGWRHRDLAPGDAARSREALRSASGQEVLGFRRARFGPVDPRELAAAGYAWDSSVNPIWLPGRYDHRRVPRTLHERDGLTILPLSASPRWRVPLFWLAMKNLPMTLMRGSAARCLARDGYVHLMWHPWEFLDLRSSGLPRYVRRPDGERMVERLASYLRWLRARSRFETISEWIAGRRERAEKGSL